MSSVPQEHTGQGDPTPHALRRLFAIGLSFAVVALATYGLPKSERLRPWVAGEGMPIARMFIEGQDEAVPTFAEATAQVQAAASFVPSSASARPETPFGAGHARSKGGVVEAGGASGPLLRIDPVEYEGASQPIEHAGALDAFFAKLLRAARREPSAIARVAHYGDSSIAADAITSTARRNLQRRFGDSGHGFVLTARGDMHYLHKDVVHRSSNGWELFPIVQAGLRPGYYGYGGVQARATGGEYALFGTAQDGLIGRKVSRFELFYQRSRGSGSIDIKVDGKRHSVLSTRGESVEDAFEVIRVKDGAHTLSLRTRGSAVRLYGVALERDKPGVVYDSLGLVGAMADRLLHGDAEHMQRQIAHRAPDLLVLGFGGNESGNKWLNIDKYEAELERVVDHMRAERTGMSCMLFGPLDQAERNERGRVVTLATIPKIVEAQRRVAAKKGCAFFDAFSAMGGEGAMAKWVRARPRLAISDLRHATPAGYEVIGTLYYKALMKAFAEYLSTRGSS